MKIVIIGAGAMGSLYGAMLSKENQVTLIDGYGKVVDFVRENGVKITESNGQERTYKIPIYKSGEYKEKAELVIVFVKGTATEEAIKQNLAVISDKTIVLSLQNGFGNLETLAKFVKYDKILLGTTKHNSVTTSIGNIYHTGSGETNIGSPSKNEIIVDKIIKQFLDSNIETYKILEVKRLLWQKLFVNMTINSLTSLLNVKIGFLTETSPLAEVANALIDEAVKVAKADGEEFDANEIKKSLYHTTKVLHSGKASMLQDIENSRKTEIDFINGAVVKLGEKYGIETPTHKTVVALVHSKELASVKV